MLRIREDKERLIAYYRSLGYFMARVDYQIDYYDSGEFMDVTFVIDEKQRFKVRNVSIVGNKFFDTDLLLASLDLKPGDYFNLAQMNRDQRTIRNEFYGREGFVFVDVVAEPRYLEEPGQLDLVFRINEGDRYRAGEINVHIAGDSSHTQHNVVVNLLGIRPGEIIDLQELEDSERRLRFSQIFETNPTIGEPPRVEVRPPDQSEY
jgi:outer membrane protein insertion porin family